MPPTSAVPPYQRSAPYPPPLSDLRQTLADHLLDLLHLLDLSHHLPRLLLASAYQPAYPPYTPTDLTYQHSVPLPASTQPPSLDLR
nr:hypothetical protein [uncultured Porphyromonas sp.]